MPSESRPTGGASHDLARGFVGHWTFDEGKGTIAHDFSGRGNHGTVMGGAKWAEGRIGGALKFNHFAAGSGKKVRKISLNGGWRFHRRGMINLTRPESSPVLLDLLAKDAGGRANGDAYFKSKDDPGYKELLGILLEAKAALDETPRIDMPGANAIPQERNFGRTFH